MLTLLSVLAIGEAARRLARRIAPVSTIALRASLALVLGAALLCSAYGVLGALCKTHIADVEVVFHGDTVSAPRDSTTQGAGEVRVLDPIVDAARATPRNLLPIALGLCALSLLLGRGRRALTDRLGYIHLAYVPIALAASAAVRSVARGYDALWYHLPLAAAFMRNGHLEPPGRDLVDWFPGDVELLARTLGEAFGPRAMSLVQLPFALALGPLASMLARRIGGSSRHALALCVSCPMIVFQSGLAYADVVSLAALCAAVVLLLDTRDEDALLRTLCVGLCLGLSLGSKYAALPLLAAAIPAIALHARRRAVPVLAAIGLGMLPPSWFWYARNFALTGNPIFPIAAPALHLRGLFAPRAFAHDKELELVGSRAEWWIHPWVSRLTHESGFGAAFATLVPLSLVVLAVWLARRPRQRLALPFAWGVVYLAMWWFGTPHEVRHLMPLVVLLGVPATRLVRALPPLRAPLEAALVVGLLVVVRIQLYTPAPEESARAWSSRAFYGIDAGVLDALPAGARIANLAGRPYNFPLYGPRLTLRPTEFMDATPSNDELDKEHVDYVFLRGNRASIDDARRRAGGADEGASWRVIYESAVEERPYWTFWGGTNADIVTIFNRHDGSWRP